MFGIPATGKTIEWTNASIFRIENGKIIDYTGVWGALEAVQGMGVPIALPGDRRSPVSPLTTNVTRV